MTLVKQRHARGCGPAALAMLTGQTYEQVVADFPDRDLDGDGLYLPQMDYYLADHGYAIRRMPMFGWNHKRQSPWPPAPFADAHLCMVIVMQGAPVSHFVVMLRDGSVLDPLKESPKTLADYWKVENVAGVYKVA